MIDKSKKYTSDGIPVRFLEGVGTDACPIVGVVIGPFGTEYLYSWTVEGMFHIASPGHRLDLIPVKEKKTGWINIYPSALFMARSGTVYSSRALADQHAEKGRVACISIEWEEQT